MNGNPADGSDDASSRIGLDAGKFATVCGSDGFNILRIVCPETEPQIIRTVRTGDVPDDRKRRETSIGKRCRKPVERERSRIDLPLRDALLRNSVLIGIEEETIVRRIGQIPVFRLEEEPREDRILPAGNRLEAKQRHTARSEGDSFGTCALLFDPERRVTDGFWDSDADLTATVSIREISVIALLGEFLHPVSAEGGLRLR